MQNKQAIKNIETDFENREIILKGRAVSRGIGIGKTLCLHGQKRQFYRIRIEDSRVQSEITRFRAAVRLAKSQLENIASPNVKNNGANQISIFDTQQLFLSDKSLLNKIESTIIEQKINAEWAVKLVTDTYINTYRSLSDKHLREKYIDLEDVTERLLTTLGGEKNTNVEIDINSIIIAKEIHPSTLIEISQGHPKAIVTENGGWTSHTFILARELNLPAVTGVKNILRNVETGENIIVDGFHGNIVLRPSETTLGDYRISEAKFEKTKTEDFRGQTEPPKTLDGFEVTIRTNLELADKYNIAKSRGAKGIGLYRSEYLFNQNRGFPSEDEQFKNYQAIARTVGKDGVRIRTFDLNFDDIATHGGINEKNPALGLCGIRLSYKFEEEFRRQIRAILRAAHKTNIDIVLPMISDVSEITWAKGIIEEEKTKLGDKSIAYGNPKIGSMIEVPSAVFSIDRIILESDFLCVGTNDLVQYLLAVDRDNEDVADWFRSLHPAVLTAIKLILDSSRKHKKQVIICGEMAASPLYVPILIAYGANELSMNYNSIFRVQKIISGIALEEAKSIVTELEKCKSANETEELTKKMFAERWAHFSKDFSFSN